MQQILAETDMGRHYLYPGEIFSTKEPCVVHTILGSCVAVFLWDTTLQSGGINHYLLPLWNGTGKPSYKYGNIAIPELIARMQMMGSSKKNIKAKLFGGSEIPHSKGVFNIGRRNIIFAQDMLEIEQVPVISYSVGGSIGRKVIFYTGSGEVLVSYIKQDRNSIDQQSSNSKFNPTGK